MSVTELSGFIIKVVMVGFFHRKEISLFSDNVRVDF